MDEKSKLQGRGPFAQPVLQIAFLKAVQGQRECH